MLAYVDANVSRPEWGCLAFTPEMRTNLILLQYQHQLTCSHFYSHLLMKLEHVCESDQLIFHPFPKYLLMMYISS